jgi:hypothetical protein
MAMQQDKGHFALKDAIGALAESAASFWKPMLVAAPLIGAALFFATGSHAQTSGSAAPAGTTAATGPITPIAAPEAARTGRAKVKNNAISTRVANPATTTAPATTPIAPIDAPDAARTERTGGPRSYRQIRRRVLAVALKCEVTDRGLHFA